MSTPIGNNRVEPVMDDNLYATHGSRYAPILAQDDRESEPTISYTDSDACPKTEDVPEEAVSTSGNKDCPDRAHEDAEAVASGKVESTQERAETRVGLTSITGSSQDYAMPGTQEETISSPGSSQGETFGHQEDQTEVNVRAGTNSIPDQSRSKQKAHLALGDIASQAGEDVAHPTGEASGSSAHIEISGQIDGAHGTSRKSEYGRLSSGRASPDDGGNASETNTPTMDAGRATSFMPPLGTTPLMGLESTVHRSPSFTEPTISSGHSSGRHSAHSKRDVRDIVLPRWQPDAEVTYCPICHTQFSFFVRKHHCRKCGRVVCNACSPHRITIPYQFIVQPPPAVSPSTASSISQLGPSSTGIIAEAASDFANRNGGMSVRLCNPCVPDPNPLPPQPQFTDERGTSSSHYLNPVSRLYSFDDETVSRSNSGRVRGMSTASGLGPADRRQSMLTASSYDGRVGSNVANNSSSSALRGPHSGRYSGHIHRSDPLRVHGPLLSPSAPSSHSSSPAHSSQSRGHASRHQSLSFTPGGPTSNPQPHYRSLLDVGSEQHTRTSPSSTRPLPPIPRINEEDECPVCHRVLLSRNLPDFENRRAAHIIQCIDEQIALHSGSASRPDAYTSQSQFAPPTTAPGSSSITGQQQPSHQTPSHNATPLPHPIIHNPIATTPEGRTAAWEQAHATAVLFTPSTGSSASDTTARRTGMFLYRASEKDCVDDAECTICLEEFEVGVGMARLECFCRFHRRCIQEWFVDHPGRCPVHQHDGYGF